jgi:imidazolonepropionase-like amidohydrolase
MRQKSFLCIAVLAAMLAAQPAPAQTVLFEGARLIPGDRNPAINNAALLVERGTITRIGRKGDVALPAGGTRVDLDGKTVMPAIISTHVHPGFQKGLTYLAENFKRETIIDDLDRALYFGVSTAMSLGIETGDVMFQIRADQAEGRAGGARLLLAGRGIGAPNAGPGSAVYSAFTYEVTTVDQIRRAVQEQAARRVDIIKIWVDDRGGRAPRLPIPLARAAIDEAHKRGLKVTGHLCSVTYPEAAELGIDNLEHGFFVNTQLDPNKQPDVCPTTYGNATLEKMDPDGPEAAALIKLLVDHHVAITSTLPVFESDIPIHLHIQPRVLDAMSPPTREAYLYIRNLELTRPTPNNRALLYKHGIELERKFVAAGGLLIAGLDPTGDGGTLPGFGDQREVELLVDAGFTPLEAIKIATLNGATYLNQQAHIGSIAPGKNADLVVIKGDPSTKIADIENVEIVFKDGIGYDSAKLFDSIKGRYGQY